MDGAGGGTVEPESKLLLDAHGGEAADRHGETFELAGGKGFTFEFTLASRKPGTVLDSTSVDGRGIRIEWTEKSRILFRMNDARQEFIAESESVPSLRHAAVIVDGGPGIVSFVADGCFLDGGGDFEFGWRRFHPQQQGCVNPAPLQVGETVERLRIWKSALMTAEAVSLTRMK